MNKILVIIFLNLFNSCFEDKTENSNNLIGNGIDKNRNGYSDDIDSYIKNKFSEDSHESELYKKLYYQYASYYQRFLSLEENKENSMQFINDLNKLNECFYYVYLKLTNKKIKLKRLKYEMKILEERLLDSNFKKNKIERLMKLAPSHVGVKGSLSLGYKSCDFKIGRMK